MVFDFNDEIDGGYLDQFLSEPTMANVADRVVVMDSAVSSAGYYPSALGFSLWLDWFEQQFGA